MTEKSSKNDSSSHFALTKTVGLGWKPISVETDQKKDENILKQTITLSYVKVKRPSKGEQALKNISNLEIEVFDQG